MADNMKTKKLILKKSKLSEVFNLAPRLREDDKREVEAMNRTPKQALRDGIKYSYYCRSVYNENNLLIGIMGASTKYMPKGYATIWFLGSNESENYPLSFVKEGKKLIEKVLKDYSIFNYVYSENKSHIEYLKRIGLTVEETPIQIEKGAFYPFYKLREEQECVTQW